MEYEELEQLFNEELTKERKVKTEGKRFEDIAIEVMANEKLDRLLRVVKTRIKNKFRPDDVKPKKYV